MDYYKKYLKYKNKYLQLKYKQNGGVDINDLREVLRKKPLDPQFHVSYGNPLVITLGDLHLTIFAHDAINYEGHITHVPSQGRIFLRYNRNGPNIIRLLSIYRNNDGGWSVPGFYLNNNHIFELLGAFSVIYGNLQ